MWHRCSPANYGATSLLSAGWPHEHRCGIDVVGGAPDSRGGCGGAGGGTYFGADAGQMSVIMKARSPRVRPARPPGPAARPARPLARRREPPPIAAWSREHDHVAAAAFTQDPPSAL